MTYYRPDLAFVHDRGFGFHADACAPGILSLLEPVLGGLVVELGCGSGALTRHLVSAGHRVVATDASPAMVDLARRQVPGAEAVGRLVLPDGPIPPADAVVSVGHVLNYLPDEEALDRALVAAARALRRGGVLALDLCDRQWGEARRDAPGHGRAGDDWAIVTEPSLPAPDRFVRQMAVFVRNDDGSWRRDDERHDNVLIDTARVPALLAGEGVDARVAASLAPSGCPPACGPSSARRRPERAGADGVVGRRPFPPFHPGRRIWEVGPLAPGSARPSSTLTPALVKSLAAVFFVAAGAVVALSSALPLAEGQHRAPLVIVGVAAVGAGLATWLAPWERWPAAAMRWTLVPAALVLIAAANYYGGIEPFTYAVAFPLVFAWLGLSQPRWTSLRFAVPAALAYLLPLLAEDRPADELVTVALVIPMGVALGEGCALVATRLRTAEGVVRTAGTGIERLLEATTKLAEAETEAQAADLTAELTMDLLGADRVQVMVAEEEGSSRFVSRGQRNIPVPVGESVVDAATEPTGTGVAVRSGRTLFVADCSSSPMISPHLVRRIPCASAAFIPLPGEGGFLGAVVALWTAPRAELDQFSQRAAEVLSAEAGRVLERTRATARLTRDLGERGRTVAFLRRERTFLQLLQAVAVAANEARTVEEALQRALDDVCVYSDWPVGHAYLMDREGSLGPSGVWHLDDPERFEPFRQVTEQARFAIGAGLPGRVARSRQPAWIPDVATDHDFSRGPAARQVGLRGALGVPVVAAGDVAGVLEFFFPESRPPDESLLELVRHVGTQLGHVVERRRIQETLQTSEERVRAVIETAGDAFVAMDDTGAVTEWNRQAEVTFGWSRPEALGRPVADLIIPEDLQPAHRRALQRFLATREGTILGRRVELAALTRDGRQFPVEITLWATPVGSTFGFSAFVRDISERKRLEAELTRQALHDSLTGLPNRTLLLDRLAHALTRGERTRAQSTVLFLDLDRFKMVNDSLGHAAGDRLLAAVAERIGASVRPSDTVARLGGDEFAILLEDTGTDEAVGIAQRLGEALDAPFGIDGRNIATRASVGIATGEAGLHTPDDLLRNADLAMYIAKAKGRGRHAVFESSMHVAMVERLELEADLRRALGQDEFFVHYQPVVRLADGSIVGVEALVRWRRAGEVVPPGQFIPVAEETGLILDVGRWVLREACRQMATWHAEHHRAIPLRLSVNFSARQLQDPDLGTDIEAALADSGLEPSSLVIEVTETLLMSEPEVAAERLANLRKLGVRLAIDDFGTGYSSLSYLRRFPVDVLKIDRSFVAAVQRGPEDAALAHAIVKLGHMLELRTVAEGIETAEQLEELRSIGCDYGQGYLFAPPVAPEDVSAMLGDVIPAHGLPPPLFSAGGSTLRNPT